MVLTDFMDGMRLRDAYLDGGVPASPDFVLIAFPTLLSMTACTVQYTLPSGYGMKTTLEVLPLSSSCSVAVDVDHGRSKKRPY